MSPDESQAEIIGESVVRWLTQKPRMLTLAAVLTLGVVCIVGSAVEPQEGGIRQSEEERSANVVVTPHTIDWSNDECDDAAVLALVKAAMADPDETTENAMLALPSEVHDEARARQSRAWAELTPSQTEYQLCLRAAQSGQIEPWGVKTG